MNGLSYRNVWTADILCTWLCIGTACAGFFVGGIVVLLAARLPIDKHTVSQAFATSSPPLRSARALLHPAEDIGSALEVFGPLVTKFVRNFGREGTTPIQRGSNASLLGRVQVVEPIRHSSLGHLMTND